MSLERSAEANPKRQEGEGLQGCSTVWNEWHMSGIDKGLSWGSCRLNGEEGME